MAGRAPCQANDRSREEEGRTQAFRGLSGRVPFRPVPVPGLSRLLGQLPLIAKEIDDQIPALNAVVWVATGIVEGQDG